MRLFLCLVGLLHTLALPSPNDEANLVVRDSAVLLRDKSTLPEVVVDNKEAQEAAQPSQALTATVLSASTEPRCTGKKCRPEVTKACKGRVDACRNETECCEIDKCNVWQHVGRDASTLLVFYVPWCPVSRDFMLNYDLLRVKFEPFDNVLVAKVDADQNPNLVNDFGIDEYPALVFFRRDCYWSAGGCYDQMAWRRYNGTSNDYDEVTKWIDFELLDEQNANAFSELPQEPEAHTGCKFSKTSLPPEDMRPPPSASAPHVLIETDEGATLQRRPSCARNPENASQ